MTIIAKFSVDLNGHIYHKGEKCEYDGEITPRIAYNFTDKDGKDLATNSLGGEIKRELIQESKEEINRKAIEKTIEVMGVDGIKRLLDSMGVVYSATAKAKSLAKTLLIARGEYFE